MSKEFLGRGWAFPVQISRATGKIAISEYEQDIQEAIWIILATSKGERVMRPDFGCGIHDFVFDTVNVSTIGKIESSVREALIQWEPRIEIIRINVSTKMADEGKLEIAIDYRIRSTNNQYNLVYPFYLNEG